MMTMRLTERAQGTLVKKERVMKGGAGAADVAPEDDAAEDEPADEPPAGVGGRQGEEERQGGEDGEADDVDASGVGAGGNAASHDGQDGEAAEGNEQQDRPVDVGEEASRQHADGGSALEGGAHEADVEAAAFGVGDAGGQDHVGGGGGLVAEGLERASDDDAGQGGGEGETEQRSSDDECDADVDDAAQRDEVAEGAVQEAGDAQDDAGDRGDEAGGVTGTDVGGDSQVDQVEALEGDSAERVDAEEGQEDARGVVHPGCAGCGGAHGGRGRGPFPDHLGRDGGDAAGWGCRACRNEVSEIAHGG